VSGGREAGEYILPIYTQAKTGQDSRLLPGTPIDAAIKRNILRKMYCTENLKF